MTHLTRKQYAKVARFRRDSEKRQAKDEARYLKLCEELAIHPDSDAALQMYDFIHNGFNHWNIILKK